MNRRLVFRITRDVPQGNPQMAHHVVVFQLDTVLEFDGLDDALPGCRDRVATLRGPDPERGFGYENSRSHLQLLRPLFPGLVDAPLHLFHHVGR